VDPSFIYFDITAPALPAGTASVFATVGCANKEVLVNETQPWELSMMQYSCAKVGTQIDLIVWARAANEQAQAVLPLIASDLVTLIDACIDGRLAEVPLTLHDGATVAVVVAAPGYPGAVQPGSAIGGLDVARASAAVYSAAVERLSSGYAAVGGRVLTIVGKGADLTAARADAYRAVAAITLEGMQVRRDIGLSAGSPASITLERNPLVATPAPAPTSYAASGVDIEAANTAVRGMKRAVESTFTPHVLSKLGSYGGLFDARAFAGLAHPVLVASTDGVGTKTMVARAMNRWDTIGRDLCAHSVNDILVMGARLERRRDGDRQSARRAPGDIARGADSRPRDDD